MCANASIFRMFDSLAEQRLVWLYVASVAEVAAWSRVSSPRVSTSHTELGVHGHDVPWLCARDVHAQNGCGRPRDRRTEHTFAGRERSAAPSAWASAGGAAGWEASMRVPSVFAASGCSERVQFLPWDTA